MPLVCPHCSTSYTIDSATLGRGRTVRCARCKETWHARPRDLKLLPIVAGDIDVIDIGEQRLRTDARIPLIESPSLSAALVPHQDTLEELPAIVQPPIEAQAIEPPVRRRPQPKRAVRKPPMAGRFFSIPSAATGMVALIAALFVWRADVVRVMPQTAGFYQSFGIDVNLRGLAFKDIKLSSESVDGSSVLVIDGVIFDKAKKTVDVPRLRFIVRDAKGTAIYAWNTTPERNVLQPGEEIAFRSRLASPPADAHSIDVRFFTKRDLAGSA